MKVEKEKIIWTIGHSTHPPDEFISLLTSFQISLVADIRNYPGSKRFPHFNKEALQIYLPQNNIRYIHLKELGGRRSPVPGSVNTRWRNTAFRGYADYMDTAIFKKAMMVIGKYCLKRKHYIYVFRSSMVELSSFIGFRLFKDSPLEGDAYYE